ncbi:MAG TPA: MerR family transcriptional regulator [Bacteroidota bacterium]|jgi:DNA-binding transcriptional MerR regulator|nr:MerR family transcriptional regulator [Bacteroidota bacterium]
MKDLSIKKLYYSISEVSKITDLEQYVLRYWETEFEELKPQKNRAGNRIYTNRDIKLILYIKKLLREERYTIEGAKQILKSYNPDADGEQLKILDKPEVKTNNTVKETNIVSTEVKQGDVKLTEDVKSVLLEIKSMLEEIRDKL